MELSGKVALITGGAVRIGRTLTLALAKAGANVFIHYGRSAGPARQTQAEAQACGVEAEIYSADLADPAATQQIIPAAAACFGRVDILINSAAIYVDEDRFSDTDVDLWHKLFTINLQAPFLLCQAFAAQIPAEGVGKIINITDGRVRNSAPDHFAYRLTKKSLWTMTEMLAQELAPRITVNAVALGAILPPPGKDVSYLEQIAAEQVPLRRPGSADIVADNVLHLIRQDFLTGVVLPIDGGEFL